MYLAATHQVFVTKIYIKMHTFTVLHETKKYMCVV